MSSDFSRSLSLMRQEKGVSQRAVANDLGISQALLSHYENGIREPGLAFVVKACDYYGVSADFLLGRTLSREGTVILDAETLYDQCEEKDNVLKGSLLATLSKKLVVNSICLIFDLLGRLGNREAIKSAGDYFSTAIYKLYRQLYRADRTQNEDFFSVPPRQFLAGIPTADMLCREADYAEALSAYVKENGACPPMNHDALMEGYPGMYQSLLQIIHTSEERINGIVTGRGSESPVRRAKKENSPPAPGA